MCLSRIVLGPVVDDQGTAPLPYPAVAPYPGAPATGYDAAGADLGADTVLTADLRPEDSSQTPLWKVDFPFSAPQQVDIERRLTHMPVDVVAVTIDNNATISGLTVVINERVNVAQKVRAVINAAGASELHPMRLTWLDPYGSRPGSKGFVIVGACNYPAQIGEQAGSPTEQQLRREFDTCPR
jgi:hypothetical protein